MTWEEAFSRLERIYEDCYRERTPRSRELHERASRVLPAGVTYHIRWYNPYPLYVSGGEAQHVYDVDGNKYTDYWMGHGALILGHRPPQLLDALRRASRTHTPSSTPSCLPASYPEPRW
jgi:glutamate-1-semialdehyde 2,1-aminomutase